MPEPRWKPEPRFRPEQRLTFSASVTLIGVVDREPEWIDRLGTYAYDLRYLGFLDKDTAPTKISDLVHRYQNDLTLLNPRTR